MNRRRAVRLKAVLFALGALLLAGRQGARASDNPYFVTYDHWLEEPGNLEVELSATGGVPRTGQKAFVAPYLELEYGAASWWTANLYLEGQHTSGDSTIFTGWRLENRFRPFPAIGHAVPIFYLEYEHINEGSRIFKEIVGHAPDFDEPNSVLRKETVDEIEGRLILATDTHGWNLAGNLVFEKNLTENEELEFGYSLAASHRLVETHNTECLFCLDALKAGVELYGGLGTAGNAGFRDTSQYVAPGLSWQIGDETSLRLQTAFGLTDGSRPALLRLGLAYEFEDIGPSLK